MNSRDNNFKNILLRLDSELIKRENRESSMMKECVQNKLDNSLELYGEDLKDTCEYVLIRKPVLMIKEFTLMEKEKESKNGGD